MTTTTDLLTEPPQLTKHADGRLSCSFKIRYTPLPLSIPHVATSSYSLRVYLQCEEGTFGKLQSDHLRFDSDSDPPPSDIITGTVTLNPYTATILAPSTMFGPTQTRFIYVTTALIITEFRTGIAQLQEDYVFGNLEVP